MPITHRNGGTQVSINEGGWFFTFYASWGGWNKERDIYAYLLKNPDAACMPPPRPFFRVHLLGFTLIWWSDRGFSFGRGPSSLPSLRFKA